MADGSRIGDDLTGVITELAGVVIDEGTLESVLELVASLAQSTISDVIGVSITLRAGDHLATRYATADQAVAVDRVQYEKDGGPCVVTVRTGDPHDVTIDEMDLEWPAVAAAARDVGVGRVLSLPLRVHDRTIGALNLYGARPDAFTPDGDGTRARLFAHHASVVLANAAAYAGAAARAEQLLEALDTRDVIGQAKGIVMAREQCSADEAFDVLRRASQRTHRKLRDIAQEVVDSAVRGTRR